MKHDAVDEYRLPMGVAQVREITTENVWRWLALGWRDLERAPVHSLVYGAVLALISLALSVTVMMTDAFLLIPLLLAGFMLIAPLLGIGPYALSRQLERGEAPSFRGAVQAYTGNTFHLLNMGLVLLVCFLVWAMLANLLFVLFLGGLTPATWSGFLSLILGSWGGVQLLVAGVYVGGIVALLVFGVSVVSVPMLMDRQVNVFDAIQTSWSSVKRNIGPMLLWAGVLVSIVTIGFVTCFIGLTIGFPLAAHATWHAYRDLVEH
jgi:uncharacterized membrane protein